MRWTGLLLLATLLPAGGCIQADQAFTLFPDGSGKLVLNIGVKKQVIEMLEGMARELAPSGRSFDNPFEAFRKPEKLAADSEGIVAWVPGGLSTEGEWMRATVVGYFEDINKVRLYNSKPAPDGGSVRTLSFSARMTKTAEGGTITLSQMGENLDALEERLAREKDPEAAKAALELMKPMLQDLRVRLSLTLPGAVAGSTGFLDVQGRTATIAFDGHLIATLATDPEGETARRLKAMARGGSSTATWRGDDTTPEARAAFADEMAAARASWAKLRGVPPPPPPVPGKPPSLAADAEQFSDDEVDRLFIEAQLKIAREQIERGKKEQARATLEGVLKDFPKAKAAQEAKKLLDGLK